MIWREGSRAQTSKSRTNHNPFTREQNWAPVKGLKWCHEPEWIATGPINTRYFLFLPFFGWICLFWPSNLCFTIIGWESFFFNSQILWSMGTVLDHQQWTITLLKNWAIILLKNDHSSFIHCDLKMGTTQISFSNKKRSDTKDYILYVSIYTK